MLSVVLAPRATAWPSPVRTDERGMVIAEACGFRVRVSPELIAEPDRCVRVLTKLRSDLSGLEEIIPEHVFGLLRRRTTFWIENQGAVVPGGMSGRGMVFHPSAIWLRTNGLDPERAGGIEIVRAEDFLAWADAQPMMGLHELAHAYHHLIGIEDASLSAAFDTAVAEGTYDRVRRGGRDEPHRERAYAMSNIREYFSELSEAYFGVNDFEPFDRAALRAFDPAGHAAVERLWGLDVEALASRITPEGRVE